MKICLVSREYPDELRGGIGSYTAGMAKALAQAGHEIHVVARSPERARVYEDGGVRVHKIAPRALRIPILGRYLANLLYSAALDRYLVRLARTHAIEIVEAPDFGAEAFFYALRPRRPTALAVRLHTPLKIVQAVNGVAPGALGRRLIATVERMERSAILRSDAVSCPSRALTSLCRAQLALGDRDIRIYPNPVDTGYFCPLPEDDGAAREKTVLYAGQLTPRKGVDVFSQVIPLVLRDHPDATFLLVGADRGPGGPGAMAERILTGLGPRARARVRFLGEQRWDMLRDLYRRASVCVFPSRFENFPQVCLEAMACGAPVVGSACGGMAEIIEDGVSGLLARPGDAGAIGEHISRCLWRDPREMRAAARRRVLEIASLPVVADLALDFYGSLQHKQRGRAGRIL